MVSVVIRSLHALISKPQRSFCNPASVGVKGQQNFHQEHMERLE